jgi:hypothetical protein
MNKYKQKRTQEEDSNPNLFAIKFFDHHIPVPDVRSAIDTILHPSQRYSI